MSFAGNLGRRMCLRAMTEHGKSEEYRKMAAECLQRAKQAASLCDSAFLLDLAFRWQMLAQGAVLNRQTVTDFASRQDDNSPSLPH